MLIMQFPAQKDCCEKCAKELVVKGLRKEDIWERLVATHDPTHTCAEMRTTDWRNTYFPQNLFYHSSFAVDFTSTSFQEKNMIWAALRKFDLNESCASLENSSTCLLTCSPCHDVGKQEFCGKLAALDKAQINLIGIIGKPSTPVSQDKLDASMVLICCRCIAARQGSVCFHGVPFVFARQPWDRETAYKLLPITL